MNDRLKLAKKILQELQKKGINVAEMPESELRKWIAFFANAERQTRA